MQEQDIKETTPKPDPDTLGSGFLRPEIQLLHGDCLKLMFDIPENSVDMVCCDMPYGISQNSWDSVLPLDMIWYHYKRICKKSAAIVLTASQPFTTTLIKSNMKLFKYCWVWEKSQAVGHLNSYKMPMKQHEDIYVFYKNPPVYNPQIKEKPKENIRPQTKIRKNTFCYGKHDKISSRRIPLNKTLPVSIIKFNNAQTNFHTTEKPVALIEYLIKTYSNEGDTVLDNCMGSGTAAIACLNTNRNFIGIEINDNYFQIAKKRIAEARGLLL